MESKQLYYTGSKKLRQLNLESIDFSSENIIENGEYFDIYNLKDKVGNNIRGYVVKQLKKKLLTRIFESKWFIKTLFNLEDSNKKKFDKELKALTLLKEKRVAPNLIYYNFKYEYFIFSKMDISLSSLIQLKRVVPSMAHALFSLMKRYFKSMIIHSNLNCTNVYYSKNIQDWRITEWQEYTNSDSKLDNSFNVINDFENDNGVMFNLMLYTILELERVPNNVDSWKQLKVKIWNYINTYFPLEIRKKINLFSKDYLYSKKLTKKLKEMELLEELHQRNSS